MKIADSAIHLYSQNTVKEQHRKHQSLQIWHNGRESRLKQIDDNSERQLDPSATVKSLMSDKVSLSGRTDVKIRHVQPAEVEAAKELEMVGDLNMRILQALFERLTGKKFQVIDPAKIMASHADNPAPATAESRGQEPFQPEGQGFGLVYEFHESHYEYEKTDFSASGIITTTDGKSIDFSVALSMSREFYSEQNITIRAGDALKDPLVVNFSGTAAQLTERNFSFDIDADGTRDQISFVAPGSGFLALDRNGDGVINDGRELFGALSGNGFKDLATYDHDHNGWIDENDAIYESLRIWSKDAEGNDLLLALGKAGVGALYLGHIETLFSIKDRDNALLGQVRKTGLAVMESGRMVTMQQVDLVA